VSYVRCKKKLRSQAFHEYYEYQHEATKPIDGWSHCPKRADAWARHEMVSEIYRAVRKSKSKSYKAAVAICEGYVKRYKKHYRDAWREATVLCLQICRDNGPGTA
jgi:hypothetical protein